MLSFRSLGIAIAMLLPFTAFNAPASAISNGQWRNVCGNSLGLRSATTQVDVGNAGFRMDDGVPPQNCFQPPPGNWDTRLRSTIEFIKNFPNSSNNYLLIVRCVGTAERYGGTFPKCNSTHAPITAATPNTLSTYTVNELINWVNANIP